MRKVRPGEVEPVAAITARLPAHLYATVRELAIKHDVTIGQAFDLLLDKIRIETEERCEERVKELQAELQRVARERDKFLKELRQAEEVLGGLSGNRKGSAKRGSRSAK